MAPADTWHTMPDLAAATGRSERTLWRWLAVGRVQRLDGPDGALYRLTPADEVPTATPDSGATGRDSEAGAALAVRVAELGEALAREREARAALDVEAATLRARLDAEREAAELRLRLAVVEGEREAERARLLAEVAVRDVERERERSDALAAALADVARAPWWAPLRRRRALAVALGLPASTGATAPATTPATAGTDGGRPDPAELH